MYVYILLCIISTNEIAPYYSIIVVADDVDMAWLDWSVSFFSVDVDDMHIPEVSSGIGGRRSSHSTAKKVAYDMLLWSVTHLSLSLSHSCSCFMKS